MDLNNTPAGGGTGEDYTEGAYYRGPVALPEGVNSFSTGAVVLGILSIISTAIMPVYLPVILGSISIVTALLSRGEAPMAMRAKLAIMFSCISIIANICLLAAGVYLVMNVPQFQDQIMNMIEQYYPDVYSELTPLM